MYEKLGLVEESDLERYMKKLGLRKGIDLASIDLDDVDQMLGQATPSSDEPASRKKQSNFQRMKKDYDKEEFKKIVSDLQQEKARLEQMDDDERTRYQEEKLKLKEVFRHEDVKHFPLIVKASTAGTLETLLQETDKLIKGLYRVNVIDYSVGPITEGDLNNAH